ncbi:MAG: hypothetical protein HFJ79_06160 [Clostridiales bacterium]|nr:hypothetical protein [Clostridiales bacterium]
MPVLPIRIDASIQTECWSYYRAAIIEAYPALSEWFIQHYNHLFADKDFNLFYGENGSKYNQFSCYEEVLHTEGFPHELIRSEDIISFIKAKIDENTYVLFECDFRVLINREQSYTHEILIYGYDEDKQVFFTPILSNKNKWISQTISYEKVRAAYAALDCLDKKRVQEEMYRRAYLQPVTLITVNNGYQPYYDLCRFLRDIIHIWENVCLVYQGCFSGNTITVRYHEGYWACYNALIEATVEMINGSHMLENGYTYSLNIKKLYEYRVRFHNILQKQLSIFSLRTDEQIIDKGLSVINMLDLACKLSIKYELTLDSEYLWKISHLLVGAFKEEDTIIISIREAILEYLTNHY